MFNSKSIIKKRFELLSFRSISTVQSPRCCTMKFLMKNPVQLARLKNVWCNLRTVKCLVQLMHSKCQVQLVHGEMSGATITQWNIWCNRHTVKCQVMMTSGAIGTLFYLHSWILVSLYILLILFHAFFCVIICIPSAFFLTRLCEAVFCPFRLLTPFYCSFFYSFSFADMSASF